MQRIREKMPVSLSAAALNALGLVSYATLIKPNPSKKEDLEEELEKQLEPLC
jgi:hypothetical protein